MVLSRRYLDVSTKILLVVVTLGALSYYVAVAATTDISFDGAVFLQPIVSLERWGSLTHTYNTKSSADYHIPLTNLGQGMLSQYILDWPVIHAFGINHFTLQFSNLVFLVLTPVLICLLVVRMTGSLPLSLVGVILFFTTPEIKALGLQGHGEVAAAFYLLLCAFILRAALSGSVRCFYLLGFAVFLATHTKNYLVVGFPMLLVLLGYLWLRQKAVGWKDLFRFSVSFLVPVICLPLVLVLQAGWKVLFSELSMFRALISSTQWGGNPAVQSRSWSLFWEAIQVLGASYGGWLFFYLPLLVIWFLASLVVLQIRASDRPSAGERAGALRLERLLPRLDADQAVILFLFGLSIFYIGYWFHFSTWAIWYRRLFPFLVVNIPLLLVAAHRAWAQNSSRPFLRRLAAGCGVVAILLLGWSHVNSFVAAFDIPSRYDRHLVERIEAAEEIERLPRGARIFGIGWWQAPKLSLFSGRPFLDLQTTGREYQEGYLVLDREAMGIDPEGVQRVLSGLAAELVWENGSNKVYFWKRGADASQAKSSHRIELWQIGPDKAMTDGKGFYAQPGNGFAMWARTRFATPSSVLMWGNRPLSSSVQPDGLLMTAIVPADFFKEPGGYPVWVYDKVTRARSGSIMMTIEAR